MKQHSTDVKEKGISAFAVKNMHFIVVCCLAVGVLGVLSLSQLPKDLLPAANSPAIQILSFYAGMPVEHVEKNLTARFERYTGQAIGIQRQESKSLVGVSVVKNFFSPETDVNTAIAQTTSLVMSVLRRLPPGAQPPLILPFDPAASVPLALVAVSGDFQEKDLYDTARYDVRNAIQSVTGAMAPTVMGGAERQVVIYLDPKKLQKYNFSSLDIVQKLNNLNTFIPTGNVKLGNFDYQIQSNGLVDKIAEMNDFPLRAQNGVSLFVRDVGEARDANKIQTNVVRIDGKRQVYVPIYRQPGANSIKVINDVKAELERLSKRLGGFKLRLVADQSIFIRHAISSITEEALIGGGLAALLVLLFLGNPRATGGILLSLPLSLLSAFIGLKISGQTINAMTLGGLALAIGVLVDNSIVVLENVTKKLEKGLSPRAAAIEGAAEVAMPVLSSTLATLIVFFPVVFLSGIVHTLFSALAKSVIFAMIGSYIASMTVMPLFAAYFLKSDFYLPVFLKKAQLAMQGLTKAYGIALRKALAFPKTVLGTVVLLFIGALALAPYIGSELFPRADAGNFVLALRLPSGTKIEETEKLSQTMEANLRKWVPANDLKMIITNAGVYYDFPAAFTPNSGTQDVFFQVELTEDRKNTSQYYAKLIREKIRAEYPDLDLGMELGGLLSSALNNGLRAPINIQIEGPEMQVSHTIAENLVLKLKQLPGAVDVRVQQRLDAPQVSVDIDRKSAATIGLNPDEVVKNIVSAVSGSTSFQPAIWVDPKSGIDYLLGVQFPESSVTKLEELSQIPITGRNQERSVPLSKIAKISTAKGPSEINHVQLKPVIDIFMDAQGRDIGSLSSEVERIIKDSNLPGGYTAEVRGEYQTMKESIGSLGGGFALAALLVYLILVAQFRSFSIPSIVMASVPLGLMGIVYMLFFTHTYFSIQAAIGAIFMIGIAVANGVLLIEFILHNLDGAPNLIDAILEGAQARLRPILMTSLSAVLGLVPMALGLGQGSEANIPLGRAVIGGQLASTFLTLFVIPILFKLLKRDNAAQAEIIQLPSHGEMEEKASA